MRQIINLNLRIHDRLAMCGGLRLRVRPAMTNGGVAIWPIYYINSFREQESFHYEMLF
jgi:hypothetical protein